MQQRLGLGVALLGDPDLVLLDEPTSALDPIGRIDVRAIVRAARDRGATVILNSHLLTEVERVCDRVVILNHGRVVAAGPLDEIVAADGVRVRVTGLDRGRTRGHARLRAGRGRRGVADRSGRWRPTGSRTSSRRSWRPAAGSTRSSRAADRSRRASWSSCARTGPGRAAVGADGPAMIVIARLTVSELVRRRVVWVLAALTVVSVALVGLGPRTSGHPRPGGGHGELEIRVGVSQVLILIAFMFSFVLAMTAAFIGAPAIGGDLESGVA